MRLLITGTGGFLGARMMQYFEQESFRDKMDVIGINRNQMDITDAENVKNVMDKYQPDAVVHCSAISDIGVCEKDPDVSYKVNVEGPKYIAASCSQLGARMIFCSSDQVYSGTKSMIPHKESDKVSPGNHYARQKLEAEQACADIHPDTVSLRLSWMYDWFRLNDHEHGTLLTNILTAVRDRKDLTYPVNDYRSITDVWEVVKQTEKALFILPGVYHFGSPNTKSTFEIASFALRQMEIAQIQILPDENTFHEQRRNLMMNMEKTESAGILFPDALTGIRNSIERMKERRRDDRCR